MSSSLAIHEKLRPKDDRRLKYVSINIKTIYDDLAAFNKTKISHCITLSLSTPCPLGASLMSEAFQLCDFQSLHGEDQKLPVMADFTNESALVQLLSHVHLLLASTCSVNSRNSKMRHGVLCRILVLKQLQVSRCKGLQHKSASMPGFLSIPMDSYGFLGINLWIPRKPFALSHLPTNQGVPVSGRF